MDDSKGYVQILVTTLEKQQQVLQQILAITENQREIANMEPFDEVAFDNTLNQKEMLISRLNELDDGFASVFGRVRQEITTNKELYGKELQRIQTLIRECTDIGNELRVLEQRNYDRLTQCFAGKQREYGVRQAVADVASKYHRTMYNLTGDSSRYFNKKN